MNRHSVVIVTPALADANNGNWQTARRWARMLAPAYRLRLAADWVQGDEDLMIALHARKSAAPAARWKAARPTAPLLVVLTGTDLYRDIATDRAAQSCLAQADALVVLNELGLNALPEIFRPRAQVLLQSCPPRQAFAKTSKHLRALMVGHLRDEKSPQTYFAAAGRLLHRPDILLDHIGQALDPALGAQATELMAVQPRYRWLGGLPHAATRRRIQAAHVLVHPSRMEGGAHVVMEAVASGTPVLASRIDGNLGLLGADYAGIFEPGDDAGLARLLERAADDPDMLPLLQRQCARRRPLFEPARERAGLQRMVASLLAPGSAQPPIPPGDRS